jgi:lauroyl/myristoyl acyltransferase
MASMTATGVGFTASFSSPAKRAMIERHLQRVNPKLRGASLRVAAQQAFDSYARYYVESFRLPSLSAKTVARTFKLDGYEQVPAALEQGKGCIIALPHLGGWEWAGRWLADQGVKITVVVEALDPPELFEWFADLRKALGMNIIPTGPNAGNAVMAALKRNEVVCLRAIAISTARGWRSSSSVSAPRCRPGRPCSGCAWARRCCLPRCTSPTSTTATTRSCARRCRWSAAAACARTLRG